MNTDYTSPIWFDQLMNKMASIPGKLPFSIMTFPIDLVKKTYKLPALLSRELTGFTNLLAVYLNQNCFLEDRIETYRNDAHFLKIAETDYAGKIIRKLKLISITNAIDAKTEQELSLTLGLINRLQKTEGYRVKCIHEKFYIHANTPLVNFSRKKLIHLTAISTKV